MRATDLLTCLTIDFSDNHFETLLVQEKETFFFISGIKVQEQGLIFQTSLKFEERLSIREFSTQLMLHKELSLYKQTSTLSNVYGYRTNNNQIIF